MSKTKELCIYIAPMAFGGLVTLCAVGALPLTCLPRAAALAAAQMGALLIAAAVFDLLHLHGQHARSAQMPTAARV